MARLELDRDPTPEEEAEQDYSSPDEQRQRAETDSILEANRDLRLNRKLRWQYARWVYFYLVGYSAGVGAMVLSDGFAWFGFSLPASVLEFLVGSTAVSSIGLVLAVTMGLFKPSKSGS